MNLGPNKNKLLLSSAIILIFILGYFGGWWDDLLKISKTESIKPAVPSIDMSRTRLIGWQDGKKTWEVAAKRIWQSTDGNIVYFQEIDKGIAFSVKDKQVDFKAGWARWEKLRQQLFLGDSLEVTVENGTIFTEEAVMNYRNEDMICPREVYYSKNDTWATAKSMRLNFSKEELYLEGEVELVQKNDHLKAAGVIYNFKEEDFRIITPKEVIVNP